MLITALLCASTWADLMTERGPALAAKEGQLVEGIVLNHYGGGIPGAVVRIESLDAGADAPPLAEGTTSATGDIAIQLPHHVGGPVRVRILTEGYAAFVQEIDPADGDDPPFIDATLEGAAVITGTVREAGSDAPVAEAVVRCDTNGRVVEARTDADGRYTLEGIVRGPVMVKVIARGYAVARETLTVEGDQEALEVALLAERPVELTLVTNGGEPAGQVMVEALVDPGANYLTAMTDDRGRATLRGVGGDAEGIRLRLNGERYVRMHEFAELIELSGQPAPPTQPARSRPAGSTEPIRWRGLVALAAAVRGEVVDAETRDLIVGVRVIAGREVRYDMPMAWTGLNGAYELIGLPPGDNVISFQHADHATEIREVHLNTGQSTALDARLGAGGEIGGAVVDQDGQPLPGVWVTAEDWNGYETLGLRTITDEQGRFTLAHAPGGRIEFSVVKPGFGPPVREIMAAGRRDYRIALEASAAGPSAGSERDVRIAVGKSVPDLTLTPTDGTVYKLSELRGRYVFLDFWATWCGPCVREVPNVKSLHAATKGRADFVLIGVSLDQDRDAFRKFVDEKGMNWPQVVGPKSGAREAFEALEGFGIPYTCLIGPDGRMLAQHLYGESMAAEVTRHLSDSEEP